MLYHIQIKTLVRMMGVIAIGSIASTFVAEPKADAASQGYGVSAATTVVADAWHDPSLIEGRSVSSGR